MIPVVTSLATLSEKEWTFLAGDKIAAHAIRLLEEKGGTRVVLLVGKEACACVAGLRLREAGYTVRAVRTEISGHFMQEFPSDRNLDFSGDDLIIDGLSGNVIGDLIERANDSQKPILSIDLPAGLDGATGKILGSVIRASVTVVLGFPKIGLYSKEGWDAAGKQVIEELGLSTDEVQPLAFVPRISDLRLPPMIRSHHKYERGFVLGFGGSSEFKGAVKLSGTAALHTGAGIVKLFTLEDVGPMADELIADIWTQEDWQKALAKASAVFVGPGLGRSEEAKQQCKAALHDCRKPLVIDADALFFLPEMVMPKLCVLTPHHGEMIHLLGGEKDLWSQCQAYVEEHRVIVVLKGAPTCIFSAGALPVIVPFGDPGMATAGSGDVLTGMIVALLAQGQPLRDAAILGVTLHQLAGESAAAQKTSYGYSAGDLIAHLPDALKQVLDNSQ